MNHKYVASFARLSLTSPEMGYFSFKFCKYIIKSYVYFTERNRLMIMRDGASRFILQIILEYERQQRVVLYIVF